MIYTGIKRNFTYSIKVSNPCIVNDNNKYLIKKIFNKGI